MIRVNLAKKSGRSGGAGAKLDLKNLNLTTLLVLLRGAAGGDEEGKKFDLNGPVPKLLISILVCYFVGNTLDGYRDEQLKKVDEASSVIEKQKDELAKKIAKIKGFEPIKKQLEEDEKAVRLKLDVVNKLLADRNAPAKMLMQIAQSIPDEVWLTSLSVGDEGVRLNGSTPGYSQVSDFIKNLNNTSQFTDIKLSGITETSATSNQRIQTFDLTAKRRANN